MRSRLTTLLGIGVVLLCLGVGGLVGVVTTFTHRQLPPGGLLVGIAIVVTLVVGMRLAFERRIEPAAGAAGVAIAIVVLASPTPGGSVLIANDALGWVWATVPVAAAGIAVAWPRPKPRPDSE